MGFFFGTNKRQTKDMVGGCVSVLRRPRRIVLSYKLSHHNPRMDNLCFNPDGWNQSPGFWIV